MGGAWPLYAVVLCLVLGLALLVLARRRRARAGLPAGRIHFADDGRAARPLLQSERYGLQGRPDYLIREGRRLVPVEVKSRPAPAEPYPSHLLQLAAYCLLVEDTTGRAPRYGIIRYADRSFRVPYTPALRRQVLETMAEMRQMLESGEPPAPAHTPRCAGCGYHALCWE